MYKQIDYKELTFTYTKKEDLPNIIKMLAKENVCENVFFGPNTKEDTEYEFLPLIENIEQSLSLGKSPESHIFTVTKEETFIGQGGLIFLELSKDNYLIGYTIDDIHWGKGYGLMVAEFLLDFAFNKLNAHKVTGDCMRSNTISQRIMKKLGFKKEGLVRDDYFCKGKYHDNILYGILFHEYKNR